MDMTTSVGSNAPAGDLQQDSKSTCANSAASTKFDLSNALHNTLTSNFKACRYYETNANLPISLKTKKLFLMHINIRSVNKNFALMNHELLNSLAMLPDLICLSKTKLKNHPLTNVSIPGYAPLITVDSDTNAGGVGAYVSENFSATVLGKNLLQSNCEDLWLQIVEKSSREIFNLDIIYRHPKGDVNDFISALNEKLFQKKQTQKYYIHSDLNIDVNPMNCCSNASTSTQMVASNGAYSLIDKPTHITNTSQTVIDHIITNDTTSIIYPIIFLSDITDHHPVACVLTNGRHEQKN